MVPTVPWVGLHFKSLQGRTAIGIKILFWMQFFSSFSGSSYDKTNHNSCDKTHFREQFQLNVFCEYLIKEFTFGTHCSYSLVASSAACKIYELSV